LPAVFCVETLAGLMIRLVGAEVDDRIRRLLDSRHASRLEDADMNGESELPLGTRNLARRRRLAKH
jgi:hypothetical protein